ncbi:MAG: hypothetical protein HY335_02470, partial [Deinococcus sp.]|nr:hypothetical protein [Deinococcus sp.]
MALFSIQRALLIGLGGTGVSIVTDVYRRAKDALPSAALEGLAFLGLDASVGEELRVAPHRFAGLDELFLDAGSLFSISVPDEQFREAIEGEQLGFLGLGEFVPRRYLRLSTQEAGSRGVMPLARAGLVFQRDRLKAV